MKENVIQPRLHKDWIDPRAHEIVRQLQTKGFATYLVGGCVRDLLVGIHPKDFDIATSARPNQVKRIVPYSYVIGRRFRLVLVKDGDDQFEVATFRRAPTAEEEQDENLDGENLFGNPQQDSLRRDFTCNALFYDPISNDIIDYSGGVKDIEDRILRVIGHPQERMIEDPIRILRALRLSVKIGLTLEPQLRESMVTCSSHLVRSVLPRRREELLKLLRLPNCTTALIEGCDLGVFKSIFPSIEQLIGWSLQSEEAQAIWAKFEILKSEDLEATELFAVIVLLWAKMKNLNLVDPDSATMQDLKRIMRDELGMFNLEQSLCLQALQLQPQLQNPQDFLRKGRRRRNSFLNQEAFPLSFQVAWLSGDLSQPQLEMWRSGGDAFASPSQTTPQSATSTPAPEVKPAEPAVEEPGAPKGATGAIARARNT